MDFWSDLSKKISSAADTTVKGAEKLTDIAKIKYSIATLRDKLEDVYIEIGSLHYDEIRKGCDNSIEISEKCMEADGINSEIAEQTKKLAALKKYKNCESCGAKIEKDLAYCPECGTKQ